jgi:hypothetical protein
VKVGQYDVDIGLSVFNLYNRRNVWYREFDFTDTPPVITEIQYLGATPNISAEIKF